jgi:hypothetical protein
VKVLVVCGSLRCVLPASLFGCSACVPATPASQRLCTSRTCAPAHCALTTTAHHMHTHVSGTHATRQQEEKKDDDDDKCKCCKKKDDCKDGDKCDDGASVCCPASRVPRPCPQGCRRAVPHSHSSRPCPCPPPPPPYTPHTHTRTLHISHTRAHRLRQGLQVRRRQQRQQRQRRLRRQEVGLPQVPPPLPPLLQGPVGICGRKRARAALLGAARFSHLHTPSSRHSNNVQRRGTTSTI